MRYILVTVSSDLIEEIATSGQTVYLVVDTEITTYPVALARCYAQGHALQIIAALNTA